MSNNLNLKEEFVLTLFGACWPPFSDASTKLMLKWILTTPVSGMKIDEPSMTQCYLFPVFHVDTERGII